jgi:hypothetical protein
VSITGVLVRRLGNQPGRRELEDVMAMMIYDMTQQYQAGRIKTAAEQRRADEYLGTMAAGASRLWRRATRPVRALRGARTGQPRIPGYAR